MADAVPTGNEDHPGRTDACHEQRIVIGPANHRFARQRPAPWQAARWRQDFRRRVGGGSALSTSTSAQRRARAGRFCDGSTYLHRRPGRGRQARCRECRFQGVTWPGMLLTAPGWTWQTPVVATVSSRPLRPRCLLDGQHDLGRGAQGIFPVRHEHRSGMAAFAFEPNAQGRRRGDGRDGPDRNAFPLQERALLDVQFDEGGVVIPSAAARRPGRRRSRPARANLVERCPVLSSRRGCRRSQRAAQRAGCRRSRCRSASAPRW